VQIVGSVAKNVIGRLHLEQIRTGGLFFAAQTIANMPGGVGHNRRMLCGVHLGTTTGLYRNLARFRKEGASAPRVTVTQANGRSGDSTAARAEVKTNRVKTL
jgi:hypothetical protein